MPSKSVMVYSIHIGIMLKDGRRKWPKVGAIVKLPDGNLVGNIELIPIKTAWDGRFILLPPEPKTNGALEFKEQPADINVNEMPV